MCQAGPKKNWPEPRVRIGSIRDGNDGLKDQDPDWIQIHDGVNANLKTIALRSIGLNTENTLMS